MAKDIGIVLSAKDNMTSTIVKLKPTLQGFGKDLQGIADKSDYLDNTKIRIGVDFDKAKAELSSARKALSSAKEGTDEFVEALSRVQTAHGDFNNLQSQLRIVGNEAKNTTKEYSSLMGMVSKADNRAGGIMGIAGVAAATQYVGGIATEAFSTMAKSATGEIGGIFVDSAMGGMASGAAIGSMIAPGIGTAIGALAGGALGIIQGQSKVFEKEDEAYKSSVQQLYQHSTSKIANDLQAGTGIASGRETDFVSFGTLFKDKNKAREFLDSITDMANDTPFLYEDLTGMGKVLKANGFEQNAMIPTMTSIGDAGAALGMDQSDMKMVATALGRMTTSNKASTEYLNIMLERGIPVYDYLAEAGGISKTDVMALLSKGMVSGSDAAKSIIDYMGAEFKNSMMDQSKTYTGLLSTVQGMSQELQNAQGEGYNNSRKNSLADKVSWLGGKQGEALQSLHADIGAWQASLDNKKDAIYRDVMDELLNKNGDYKKATATGDGKELYRLYAAAEAQAEAQWAATQEYKDAKDANLGLIEDIQESSLASENYYKDSLVYQNKMSEGMMAIRSRLAAETPSRMTELPYINNPIMNNLSPFSTNTQGNALATGKGSRRQGFAWGLDRVPYDNYPATLHEGERVLTANQARQQGGTAGFEIKIASMTVREEADIHRIAEELVQQLRLAQMVAK